MDGLSYCIGYSIGSSTRDDYFCTHNSEETTLTENYCKHFHPEEDASP